MTRIGSASADIWNKRILIVFKYQAPNGELIVGMVEAIPATAFVNGLDDSGFPEYAGGSSIHWDDQKPITRLGKLIYRCNGGSDWTFDQLTKVEDE